MPWDEPGSTALVVLVPEAADAVGEAYRAHTAAGGEGMPPHVTLLVPFRRMHDIDDDVLAELRAVFGGVAAFDFALPRLKRFDGGVLYLEPVPAAPFVDLVESLATAFPDCPPYDGAHPDVVPHLTVAVGADEVLAAIAARVGAQLPIECRALAATLVERGVDDRWRVRTRFPFASLE